MFGNVQDVLSFVDVLFVFLFWDLHLFHLFWRVVEMYISFDMYHDRKENKNVVTFVFVHLQESYY